MNNTFDNWYGDGEYLKHYGVPGMKWGVRRYQNRDGTLTEAGKKRYGDEDHKRLVKNYEERVRKASEPFYKAFGSSPRTTQDALDALDSDKRYIALRKAVGRVANKNEGKLHKAVSDSIAADKAMRKMHLSSVKRRDDERKAREADIAAAKENAEYTERLCEYANTYINQHFSKEERKIARAYIYHNYMAG